jgi:VWFA-related protein
MQNDPPAGNALASCSRRQFALGAASLLSSCLLARGQDEPTFSADVKVVNLLATVLSKKREIIRDLSKDDFLVSENGRPQTIRYFSRESDLPLTLGLLVDTSMSQRRVLNAERGASLRFFDQVLRENKDKVFIMQFDMNVQMKTELTSSRRTLDEALSFVDTPTRSQLQNQYGGGTLLYDAVVMASKDTMKPLRGRKALIILTDGVDTGSDAGIATAIEAAERSDTLIYSILFSDSGAYGLFGGGEGRGVLVRMSKETGGGFFDVSKKQTIDQVFNVIQEELRSQYSIGYVSDEPVRISEFRKLALTTKQKGLIVQARDRYWAQR